MSAKSLLEPIVNNGIKNINYFQGRVLSAEDLREQEQANRRHRRQLGRVFGSGVVGGLEISVENTGGDNTPPVVRIHKGMGINREGELLELPVDYVDLQLSRDLPSVSPDIKVFNDCAPLDTDTLVPSGAGLYILVMSPAAQYEDFAPKSGLQSQGIASGCGRRYVVEGVQYRLVQFDPMLMDGVSDDTLTLLNEDLLSNVSPVSSSQIDRLSLLRNIVAHICFGTEAKKAIYDPYHPAGPADAFSFDSLIGTESGLDNCDIPLALIYWTLDGITFVDHWSVRRRLIELNQNRGGLVGQVDSQITDAMILQFQEQMETLATQTLNNPELTRLRVSELFRYLPPSGSAAIAAPGSPKGFIFEEFFEGYGSGQPTFISQYQALSMEDEALRHKPIDVKNTDIVQLYWIRENVDAVNAGASKQRYLFFTTRELHGFSETDNAYDTLLQTWRSYHNLLRKEILLPDSVEQAALPVRVMLQTDIQAIIQFAMVQAGAAAGRMLNRQSVFNVFEELYDLQTVFSEDLLVSFDSDPNHSSRQDFSETLTALLNNADTGGGDKGLKPAIEDDSYQSLLAAQQKTNSFVSTWSGEFIAGIVDVKHIESPDGDILVAGQTFTYVISLLARTDARAEIGLSALVSQVESGTWGGAVEIRDAESGAAISSLFMNPGQRETIHVVVNVPVDINPGESVVIDVNASIPPPTDRTWSDSLNLQTGEEAGDAKNWTLSLNVVSPTLESPPTVIYPDAGVSLPFIFDSQFGGDESVQDATVTMTVSFNFTNSSRSDWGIAIDGRPGSETAPDSGVFEFTFPLSSASPPIIERTQMFVQAPTTRQSVDQQCSFGITIQTTVTDPETLETVDVVDSLTEDFVLILESGS